MANRPKNQCGARNRQGNPCGKPAGWGTAHPGTGRCRLHGGASTGAANHGNQNARRHGVFSKFLTTEDLEFLATSPTERMATLQGLAELRAFRAHRASDGEPINDALDQAFVRNARIAANIARTRLVAAGKGLDDPKGEDELTNDERIDRVAGILERGAAAGDGASAGAPSVATGEPATD